MQFNDIQYSYLDNQVYGIPEGETEPVQLVWLDNYSHLGLHPSVAWARAEQALLQEQRDAEIAREKEQRLIRIIDNVLRNVIPINVCRAIPNWSGTVYIRDTLINNLRTNGYIQ